MLSNRFDFKKFENDIIRSWDSYLYKGDSNATFSMILPPPNITGNLHIGHSLCFLIQDVICRVMRAKGETVLWQSGLDHAGIAGQLTMLKQMNIDGTSLSREELTKKLNSYSIDWKRILEQKIISQMKTLGLSCNFDPVVFSLDEERSKIVVESFVKLYQSGLIYRDKKMVNFDVKLSTAISDLEVVNKKQSGKIWHIRYNLCSSSDGIVVATTRPETIFGDTAIAVNSSDERYRDYIGQYVYVPIISRKIPIVADSEVDMEKYTGALKITPAHDFFDFELGARHNLEQIVVIDKSGKMNQNVPEELRGLDRFAARKKVLEMLGDNLVKSEDITHTVPFAERTDTVLEPYITDQWFLDSNKIIANHPEIINGMTFNDSSWENMYKGWLQDLKPWCISRQISWGHKIPAWYDEADQVFIAHDKEEARTISGTSKLRQDESVLDTWFSSALWPFSAMPYDRQGYAISENKYLTNVIVSGFDILYFWIARMAIMSTQLKNSLPFEKIVVHGLIVDKQGQKMSKTTGNVIDPLEVVEKFGSDVMRLSMMSKFSSTRSIRFGDESLEFGKKFVTKIWNLAKFVIENFGNLERIFPAIRSMHISEKINFLKQQISSLHDQKECDLNDLSFLDWIKEKFNIFLEKFQQESANHRFDLMIKCSSEFIWHELCDWYLELVKICRSCVNSTRISNCSNCKKVQLETILLLYQTIAVIQPIAPFISEAISHLLGFTEIGHLSKEIFPEKYQFTKDKADNFIIVIESTQLLRSLKNYIKSNSYKFFITPSSPVSAIIAKLSRFELSDTSSGAVIDIRNMKMTISIELNDHSDMTALSNKLSSEKDGIVSKLSDQDFINYADAEVIEELRREKSKIDRVLEAVNQLAI